MIAPPTEPLNLDVEAISGICGSISIACWVVVFSPQIFENFRRGSAEGLSIQFIIVWLLGDLFNILGAVLQGVLPTMIILAIYYTIADFVLLGQCFYYRGFTWRDDLPANPKTKPKRAKGNGDGKGQLGEPNEYTGLLNTDRERRGSDWSHLSPAVPLLEATPGEPITPRPPQTTWQTVTLNLIAIVMVIASGVAGWWLSRYPQHDTHDGRGDEGSGEVVFNFWGQIFGWFCALLYLGSRLPQLLLNWRRKSTDGVSMLFFLFACLGNLTYVLSILAYDPETDEGEEARRVYGRYILVNLSWLAGSAGTLLLDMGIFVQFFMYNKGIDESDEEEWEEEEEEDYDEEGVGILSH
ncbi:vacuolar amino acid transporter YPQ3-like protein 2 [Diplogelasinospora grovesii]|uniref:Vacuolar amino acid transporter YPQ3-like protein 2 n=1 Tax=Diplogelasinospora grovesii TaxID=303347 RepID=A0AAN6S9B4_9PEZI|nr:vacuolar amino acid transporter YPQ3-like protein 2 [Diplogelasinospora grovesii]